MKMQLYTMAGALNNWGLTPFSETQFKRSYIEDIQVNLQQSFAHQTQNLSCRGAADPRGGAFADTPIVCCPPPYLRSNSAILWRPEGTNGLLFTAVGTKAAADWSPN